VDPKTAREKMLKEGMGRDDWRKDLHCYVKKNTGVNKNAVNTKKRREKKKVWGGAFKPGWGI